jgi:hypothetical protein
MAIGSLFGYLWGFSAGLVLVIWSLVGSWREEEIPVWPLWLAVPAILAVGFVLSKLGRYVGFFATLGRRFSSLVGVASFASAVICFFTGQAKHGAAILVCAIAFGLAYLMCLAAERNVI